MKITVLLLYLSIFGLSQIWTKFSTIIWVEIPRNGDTGSKIVKKYLQNFPNGFPSGSVVKESDGREFPGGPSG